MRHPFVLLGATAVAVASAATVLALPGQAGATSAGGAHHPSATSMQVASAGADDPRAAFTRGFTITNLGSHPMKLVTVVDQRLEDSGPAAGSVLEPGHTARFEVTWVGWYGHTNTVEYLVLDGQDTPNLYRAQLTVVDNVVCTIQQSTATVERGRVTAGGDVLTVLDPADPA